MRRLRMKFRAQSVGVLCSMGILCQFGGCDIGTITTSTTLDGRDAIIQLIRGALLTPIDAFITNAVNEAFDANE